MSIIYTSILMMCIFLPASAMSQSPFAEITPLSGLPEAALKITGTGFQPDEEVEILFVLEDSLKIGLGTEKVDIIAADKTGAFTANSAIPRMAKPGRYKIEIIGNKGSEIELSLEVAPKK